MKWGGHYFLSDKKRQAILVFDQTGQFLNSSHERQGEGPGEYRYFSDFCIDKERNLCCLLEPAMQRIHYYTPSWEYLCEEKYPSSYLAHQIDWLQSGQLLLYGGITSGYYRYEASCIEKLFEDSLSDQHLCANRYPLSRADSTLYFSYIGINPVIYRFDTIHHTLTPRWKIDLGNEAFSVTEKMSEAEYMEKAASAAFVADRYVTDRYLHFFVVQDRNSYYCRYRRDTKQVELYRNEYKRAHDQNPAGVLFSPPHLIENDTCYFLCPIEELSYYLQMNLLTAAAKAKLTRLAEDDNPVIIKYIPR